MPSPVHAYGPGWVDNKNGAMCRALGVQVWDWAAVTCPACLACRPRVPWRRRIARAVRVRSWLGIAWLIGACPDCVRVGWWPHYAAEALWARLHGKNPAAWRGERRA